MNYWAWGGKYIGSRSGEYLYSSAGNPIGVFCGNELYDFSGKYIGEIRNGNRIIVNKSSKNKRRSGRRKPYRNVEVHIVIMLVMLCWQDMKIFP